MGESLLRSEGPGRTLRSHQNSLNIGECDHLRNTGDGRCLDSLDLRKRGWERLDQTIVVIVKLIPKSQGHTKASINCRTPSEADKDLLKTALDDMSDDMPEP